MSAELLRVYYDPREVERGGAYDGYPRAWHKTTWLLDYGTEPPFRSFVQVEQSDMDLWGAKHSVAVSVEETPPIKDLIRDRDGHRCLRCGHPYRVGEMGSGEWTPCDEQCTHGEPVRFGDLVMPPGGLPHGEVPEPDREAQWRILTVHHLNGVKHDCRWWNLVSLCQRCHLTIQGKVRMGRPWVREHSAWFKPFAAAYYAESIAGEELTRGQVDARLDELLDLQPHTERML